MRNTARCATGHDRPESAVTIAGISGHDRRNTQERSVGSHRSIDRPLQLDLAYRSTTRGHRGTDRVHDWTFGRGRRFCHRSFATSVHRCIDARHRCDFVVGHCVGRCWRRRNDHTSRDSNSAGTYGLFLAGHRVRHDVRPTGIQSSFCSVCANRLFDSARCGCRWAAGEGVLCRLDNELFAQLHHWNPSCRPRSD